MNLFATCQWFRLPFVRLKNIFCGCNYVSCQGKINKCGWKAWAPWRNGRARFLHKNVTEIPEIQFSMCVDTAEKSARHINRVMSNNSHCEFFVHASRAETSAGLIDWWSDSHLTFKNTAALTLLLWIMEAVTLARRGAMITLWARTYIRPALSDGACRARQRRSSR